MTIAPVFAGNFFAVAFGRNMDAHTGLGEPLGYAPGTMMGLVGGQTGDGVPGCRIGRGCYVDTLYMAAGACVLAVALSVWAGCRERARVVRVVRSELGRVDGKVGFAG